MGRARSSRLVVVPAVGADGGGDWRDVDTEAGAYLMTHTHTRALM